MSRLVKVLLIAVFLWCLAGCAAIIPVDQNGRPCAVASYPVVVPVYIPQPVYTYSVPYYAPPVYYTPAPYYGHRHHRR